MIRWQDISIDRAKRTIARDGRAVHFPMMKFRLACALLLAGPTPKEALFDLLYDDRDDGGPLGGIRTLDVMLTQMKPRLAIIDIEIRSDGPWHFRHKRYWAAPIALPESFDKRSGLEAAE